MAANTTQIIVDLIARDKASQALAKSALTLGALGLAATKFAKDSVKAFSESEDAQNKLNFAYQKFPKAANASEKSMVDLAMATQQTTVFSDEATKSAEALLLKFNLTGKQVEQLIPLVQDYAAATGQDLVSATQSIGKAFEGNARALKAIGINFHATGDTAKDFATIQKDLNEKVGGFAVNQGKTAAGQAEILKNQYNELQEVVGAALVPALLALAKTITPVLEAFTKLPGPVKEVVVVTGLLSVATLVAAPRMLAFVTLLKTYRAAGLGAAIGLDAAATGEAAVGTAAGAAAPKMAVFGGGLTKLAAGVGLVLTAETIINSKTGWFDRPTKGVQELNSNTDTLTKTLNDAIPATQSLADHLGLGLDNVAHGLIGSRNATDAARQSLTEYDHTLAGLAKDNLPAASIAWDRIVAVGFKAGATFDELKAQFPELVTALGLTKAATDKVTGSVNTQADAYATLMGKLNTYIGALETSKDKSIARAQTDYDAVVQLKALGRQHKITADDAATAWGVEKAAAQAAADAVTGVANKNKAYRDELVKLRDHLKKGSPLWKSLDDYITKLNGIKTSITTEVRLNISANLAQNYAAGIHAAGSSAFWQHLLTSGTGGVFGGPGAKGIKTKAGMTYLVGEEGPELWTAPANGQVHSNASLRNATSSGGNTIIVNVYGADPNLTVRAIDRYARANGGRRP